MCKSRKWLAVMLILLMICSCETGLAGTYVLPSSVTALDSEAFAGNTSLTEITLQSGVTSIGGKCFYGCSNLYRIRIPETVTSIGSDCFTGCLSDLVIQTAPGSYAMKWARDHHADFQADTHYRAFLIGQTYDGEWDMQLSGTLNDTNSMAKCLSNADGTAYTIKIGHDLTASEILNGIDSVFGNAQDQDVSFFFYAGHGDIGGVLCGVRDTEVSPSQLRQKLDQIRGRKIIVLDCCYSGGFITSESGTLIRAKEDGSGSITADFVGSFISAFGGQKDTADDFNRYYILAAAEDDESSYEIWLDEETKAGAFTSYFAKGLGYDAWSSNYLNHMPADTNNSGAVSIREAYQYVIENLPAYYQDFQHAQVFPSGCVWMSIIRAR